MRIVKKKGIQSLLRKPEQEKPLGRLGRIIEKSVFERNVMGGLDCFCQGHDKSEWKVLLYVVVCNKLHRQLCWYIDSMNIVFTFLYAVFCDCHHHLGSSQGSEMPDYWNSHNRVRKKVSEWLLFVSHVFKLCIYRMSQEECAKLRESIPYVKLY